MTRAAGGGPVEPGMPDFALLKLPEPVAGAQPLALTPTADKLLDVVAAGYPASVVQVEQGMQELQQGRLGTPPELVLTRGSISTIQRLENGLVVMPHSADISPGNSGGPLVDTCGRVVGINTFVSFATQVADRVKYAQKTESLLPWLQQQNVQAPLQTEACQPVVPGLPAVDSAEPVGGGAEGAMFTLPGGACHWPGLRVAVEWRRSVCRFRGGRPREWQAPAIRRFGGGRSRRSPRRTDCTVDGWKPRPGT